MTLAVGPEGTTGPGRAKVDGRGRDLERDTGTGAGCRVVRPGVRIRADRPASVQKSPPEIRPRSKRRLYRLHIRLTAQWPTRPYRLLICSIALQGLPSPSVYARGQTLIAGRPLER